MYILKLRFRKVNEVITETKYTSVRVVKRSSQLAYSFVFFSFELSVFFFEHRSDYSRLVAKGNSIEK